MLSAFNRTHTNGDVAFVKLAAKALEDFSERVLDMMIDPKSGLISESKFMPSISEMKDWCKKRTYDLAPIHVEPVKAIESKVDEEERKRVLEKFEKLVASIGSRGDLFNQYMQQVPPGGIIDVQSDDYRRFCNAAYATG